VVLPDPVPLLGVVPPLPDGLGAPLAPAPPLGAVVLLVPAGLVVFVDPAGLVALVVPAPPLGAVVLLVPAGLLLLVGPAPPLGLVALVVPVGLVAFVAPAGAAVVVSFGVPGTVVCPLGMHCQYLQVQIQQHAHGIMHSPNMCCRGEACTFDCSIPLNATSSLVFKVAITAAWLCTAQGPTRKGRFSTERVPASVKRVQRVGTTIFCPVDNIMTEHPLTGLAIETFAINLSSPNQTSVTVVRRKKTATKYFLVQLYCPVFISSAANFDSLEA
jgi:hypothetical protein